jgi:succinyl-CoA synthetase beta subunit
MNAPEHIGKELLRGAGIAVPAGVLVNGAAEAGEAARNLGGRVVLKAQVPAGKRGKGGGIRFARGEAEAREAAGALLGSDVNGHRVSELLVESAVPIARELYAAVMNDPTTRSARLLFSTSGGMDVEDVAPEAMQHAVIDIRGPFAPEATRARWSPRPTPRPSTSMRSQRCSSRCTTYIAPMRRSCSK